jgi:anti-anti-sigma regulatory factor
MASRRNDDLYTPDVQAGRLRRMTDPRTTRDRTSKYVARNGRSVAVITAIPPPKIGDDLEAVALFISGEIDTLTVQHVRGQLAPFLDGLPLRTSGRSRRTSRPTWQNLLLARRSFRVVVLDISLVSAFSTVGSALLIEASTAAIDHDQDLRVVIGSNQVVRRPLEATGLIHALAVFADLDAALTPSEGAH